MTTRNRVSSSQSTSRAGRTARNDDDYDVSEMITSHPLAVAATAFGVGMVVGVVAITSCMPAHHSHAHVLATRVGHRLIDTLSQMAPNWLR